MARKLITCSLLTLLLISTANAQDAQIVRLWPEGAFKALGTIDDEVVRERGENPRDRGIERVHVPTLEVFLPEAAKATGAAVVICPGGGYGGLAYDKEGVENARWLNTLGVAGLVLKYRLRDYGHPAPLHDVQRALRTARTRAEEWRLKPDRIGVCGSSAGGHLAASAATHYDRGNAAAADPVDRQSCRPDFLIALYPVISMQPDITHAGSRTNLLGPDPKPALVDWMSNELQVTPDSPPAFLVHATDDRVVPVENSTRYYLACKEAGVPAAMHLYQEGGHGFGLRPQNGRAAADWPAGCAQWLAERGVLTRSDR